MALALQQTPPKPFSPNTVSPSKSETLNPINPQPSKRDNLIPEPSVPSTVNLGALRPDFPNDVSRDHKLTNSLRPLPVILSPNPHALKNRACMAFQFCTPASKSGLLAMSLTTYQGLRFEVSGVCPSVLAQVSSLTLAHGRQGSTQVSS